MQNFDEKSANMHMGRLIQMLSHQMKRKNCIVTMIDGDSLTVMQKHILKFILLETLHREIYQKDIEEEFQIRKSTVTGILQLMEKNGFIYRESVEKMPDSNGLCLPKRQRRFVPISCTTSTNQKPR